MERFSNGPVYRRASEKGRMPPDGLHYIDSWIVDDDRLDTCFQLMETDDVSLFDDWLANWADLGDFEIYPVVGSAEVALRVGTASTDGDESGSAKSNGGIEPSA
jgi:hypothetical protein